MYFGTMPNGVSSPCGEVTSTTDPTVAPSSSAISLPRMIGGIAATRRCTPARSSGDSACVERAPSPAVVDFEAGVTTLGASSSAAADPRVTAFSRSLTLRSYCGSIPLSTAPRARGPREISTCS
jgi:hypothetical protein